jgi:hypothetical protein
MMSPGTAQSIISVNDGTEFGGFGKYTCGPFLALTVDHDVTDEVKERWIDAGLCAFEEITKEFERCLTCDDLQTRKLLNSDRIQLSTEDDSLLYGVDVSNRLKHKMLKAVGVIGFLDRIISPDSSTVRLCCVRVFWRWSIIIRYIVRYFPLKTTVTRLLFV